MKGEQKMRALLREIVLDMKDWPDNGDMLHSVELLSAGDENERGDRYAAVMTETTEDEKHWWTLIHLYNRFMPSFKRKIWFYLIIADGSEAPFEGHLIRPTTEQILKFLSQHPSDSIANNCRWSSSEAT